MDTHDPISRSMGRLCGHCGQRGYISQHGPRLDSISGRDLMGGAPSNVWAYEGMRIRAAQIKIVYVSGSITSSA